MPKLPISLSSFLAASRRESYAQFRGDYSRGRNSFIIATTEPKFLLPALNARAIDKVPGFSINDAAILTLANGHKELFLDPQLRKYREAHLAFLDAIGIKFDKSEIAALDSDHAYPTSAAIGTIGMVKMNLISREVNRSFGAGWEKRLTHDRPDSELKRGELAALLKALDVSLSDSKNPERSLKLGGEQLIALGYAALAERKFLLEQVEQCMLDKQTQDENYAVATGQINLEPGQPLIPEE